MITNKYLTWLGFSKKKELIIDDNSYIAIDKTILRWMSGTQCNVSIDIANYNIESLLDTLKTITQKCGYHLADVLRNGRFRNETGMSIQFLENNYEAHRKLRNELQT